MLQRLEKRGGGGPPQKLVVLILSGGDGLSPYSDCCNEHSVHMMLAVHPAMTTCGRDAERSSLVWLRVGDRREQGIGTLPRIQSGMLHDNRDI